MCAIECVQVVRLEKVKNHAIEVDDTCLLMNNKWKSFVETFLNNQTLVNIENPHSN